MSSLYQSIINVISKPSEKRTDDEIRHILAWFLNLFKKKAAVFGDLKPEIVKDIIKNCSFETKNCNDIIIKQGDIGDCFYINLRGKVSIYINHQKHDENDRIDWQDSFNADDSVLNDSFTDSSFAESAEKSRKIREKLGSYVTSLGAGEGFGEIALVSEENRTASIIADETTDLMVVNKALYARCLQAPTLRKLEEKKQFINRSPFFGNWAPKMKKLLSLCLERDIIPYDSYLGIQDESADRIYFIISGQAKVMVNSSRHQAQYPRMYPLKLPENRNKPLTANLLDRSSQNKSIGIKRRNQTFAEAEWQLKSKNFEIGIIGAGEISGLCEIIFDMPTYMQSTKCLEDCDVYYIYRRSYERLIAKRNAFCINKMKEYVYLKLSARNMRLKNLYPIDLYRSIQYMIELSYQKASNEIDIYQLIKKKYHKRNRVGNAKTQSNEIQINNLAQNIEENNKIVEQENQFYDPDYLQDIALNDLEGRMKEWHQDLGYEKKIGQDIKEGVNIHIKRSNNDRVDGKSADINSRSNSEVMSTNSSSDSSTSDYSQPIQTQIRYHKPETSETKFFNSLSIKLMPLHAHFDESLIQLNDSLQASQTTSSSAIQKRQNSASTNQEELSQSRLIDDSIIENNKYKRKQSMPNITFNRSGSNQMTSMGVSKRRFSLGQIKIQNAGKQYSKEEYFALKEELKKQMRKFSLSSVHI
ncbi:cAMP-dependent kinase regulatory subunit [Brachionus plicatilis]|uniref:cAMP-dependent kinase regulatory subunit n=1 Tax=Brachionus plicatilis TaxID=10195 RepID=A0A3M7R4X6_BRAPC|nr:cAMP-dependent kinase regulatory subunit [Brachionus plicatilis]